MENVYNLNGTSGTYSLSTSGITTDTATISYPYQYFSYPFYYPVYNYNTDITLRKVENGWILKKDGKEYILETPEKIVEFLNK